MTTSILNETVGREALIALAQYQSVTQALAEIIDNPFDYRRNRNLTVEISMNKQRGVLTVFDHGGEGMDDKGLADWIKWGTGHKHAAGDIGQWHVGGKLAAIYLANSLEIVCRRAGSPEVFRFKDPEWGSRTHLYQGSPELLGQHDLTKYPRIGQLSPETGFAIVTMRSLKPHRYEKETLVSHVANIYRRLLLEGHCRIVVDGSDVDALGFPESTVHPPIEILPQRLQGGVTVRGRVWVLDRDRLEARRGLAIKAGIRTVFNGRLITSGEEFGHNLSGRGQLQRLIGEIELQHLRPNATKDNWDRDSPQWQAVETFMHDKMQPLVAFLNQLGDARQVSRDQRKRAERVRQHVSEALKRLLERGIGKGALAGDFDQPGGRSPASRKERESGGGTHGTGEVVNRSEPPPDAVGTLLRRFRGGVPRLEFDNLGRDSRSTWRRHDDTEVTVVVNMDYPMYAEVGDTESYLAETLIRQLLGACLFIDDMACTDDH